MTTLIAIGAVQALFLAALVLGKPRRAYSDLLLAGLLGVIAAMFGTVYWALVEELPDLLLLWVNGGLLTAPVFFLYTRSLLEAEAKWRRQDGAHFLAYVASWGYLLWMILMGREARLDAYFVETDVFARSWAFNLMLLAELVSVPLYVGLSLRDLGRHRRFIRDRLAFGEGVDYRWLNTVAKAVLGFWLLLAVPDALGAHLGWSSEVTVAWSFVAATPLVFYLGFYGLRQTSVFLGAVSQGVATEPAPLPLDGPFEDSTVPTAKYQKGGLDSESADRMAERLALVMSTERPYLDPTLSLGELARLSDMSPHHLSQLINQRSAMSFYDYVNGYRVEEFQRRVQAGRHRELTLLALALGCGFNAKSSFNRIFKKKTGMTPSAYVKSQPSP